MPSQLNSAQARLVDPVLTTHAHGYMHPARVGMALFPAVPVGQRGGQVIQFGLESFRLYQSRRAPGGATKRVSFGYAGDSYSLFNHRLEATVPDEIEQEMEAGNGPGVDAQTEAVELVDDAMTLRLEYNQAQIARDPANYDAQHKETPAASDQWDADGSDPAQQVKDAASAVRSSIGMRPNTLVLGGDAFDAATQNDAVIDRVKYTSADSISAEVLARLFNVDRVLKGDAVYAPDGSDGFEDVWGNDGVLAYVPGSTASRRRPSYGYTYVLEGHPVVRQGYYDASHKSWVYPMDYERDPNQTGMGAGYLFQDLIAP